MFKRTFDFVGAFLGLTIVSPLIGIIAVLIKATSPGPIIFRQERVGLNGRIFIVFKFRTMDEGASKLGSSVTTRKDPRITPIGKFLRDTKFDELPQLVNVLKGDMSLVGPRPDVPEIINKYTSEMRRIFFIRPGITCVATLHLRDEEELLAKVHDPDTFYEKVLVPLKVGVAMEHVDRNSFAYDSRILFQTVWMLTLGRWWPIKEHPGVTQLRDSINSGIYDQVNRSEDLIL